MKTKEKAKQLCLRFAKIGSGEIDSPDKTAIESAMLTVRVVVAYEKDLARLGHLKTFDYYWDDVMENLDTLFFDNMEKEIRGF